MTATPFRKEGPEVLRQIYDQVIYRMTILVAIQKVWITDITPFRVTSGTSLDSVYPRCGDFVEDECALARMTRNKNGSPLYPPAMSQIPEGEKPQ